MKNVLVVSNFNAGRKKAVTYRKVLQKFLLQTAESFKFITIDEVNTIDAEQFDTVIAMGGDGTINKVLPLVINTERKLAIIPCGTANLLAEKLKIPTNIKKAITKLKKETIVCIDAMVINEKPAVLRFGTGYDSDIICKTPQSLKNKFGYFAYFVAGILFALRLKKREYDIKINEQDKKVTSSCIIIANASNMFKRFFEVGQNTKLNDGQFDVFLLKTTNPIILFFELVKLAVGFYANSKTVEFFKTNHLIIKNKWLNSHIDGEEHKIQNDVEFKIIEKAIKVYC